MPAPVTPIPIPFASDMSEAKREFDQTLAGWRQQWEAFVSYCDQHQPTVNGQPVTFGTVPGTAPAGQSPPVTTFGGLTATAARPARYAPSDLPAPSAAGADPVHIATSAAVAATAAASREFASRLAASVAQPSVPAQAVAAVARYASVGRSAAGQAGGLFGVADGVDPVAARPFLSRVQRLLEQAPPNAPDVQPTEVLPSRTRRLTSRRLPALPGPATVADDDDRPFDINDVPKKYRYLYDPRNTVSSNPADHDEDGRYLGPGAVPRPARGGRGGGGRPPRGPTAPADYEGESRDVGPAGRLLPGPGDPPVSRVSIPGTALARTSARRNGDWEFYNAPEAPRDYGDPTGSAGGSTDGPVGPYQSNGRFFQGARLGVNLRGGQGDPVQSLLQRAARTRLVPRYLPRAYEAAGGAKGLASGYLAVEGYKSLATDYLAQNAYENAETANVTGDRGTHFQNQLELYDTQHNANPFSRLRDPFGTERAGVQASFGLAQLSDQNIAQGRSLRGQTAGLRIGALSASSDFGDRLSGLDLRATEDRRQRNEQFAGLREAAGQQAQYYSDQAEDARKTYGMYSVNAHVGGGLNPLNWREGYYTDDGPNAKADALDATAGQVRDRLQGQLTRQQKAQQAAADAKNSVDRENAVNDRTATLGEITGDTEVSRIGFGDARGAGRLRTRNTYDAAKVRAGRDLGLLGALSTQEDAALTAESQEYGRQTGFIENDSRVSVLGSRAAALSAGHFDQAAAFTSVNARTVAAGGQFAQETAGLNPYDPEQRRRIDAASAKYAASLEQLSAESVGLRADFAGQRQSIRVSTSSMIQRLTGDTLGAAQADTHDRYETLRRTNPENRDLYDQQERVASAGNQLTDNRQLFGVGLTTARLNQSANVSELQRQRLDRTAGVQSAIDSGRDQILEARADPYLSAHPDEQRDRINAIESSSQAAIRRDTQYVGGGVGFATGGAFLTRGGFNTNAYRDLTSAQQLAGTAAGAFREAETGKGTPAGSTAKVEQLLTTIVNQNASLVAQNASLALALKKASAQPTGF